MRIHAIFGESAVVLLGRWNWWPAALSRATVQTGGEGTERDTQPAAPRSR